MSTKDFVCQQFAFLRQVNRDRTLLPVDIKVAVQLVDHFNERDGGKAYPSTRYIGDAIGVGMATVIRSVRRLEREGHLRIVWGTPGRGHPNQYWMNVRAASETDKRSTTMDHLDDDKRPTAMDHLGRIKDPFENVKDPSGANKRSIAMDQSLLVTSLEKVESAPTEKKKRGKSRKDQTDFPPDLKPSVGNIAHGEGLGFSRPEIDRAFGKFRGHYIAKGSLFSNWHQAFNNWLTRMPNSLGENPVRWPRPRMARRCCGRMRLGAQASRCGEPTTATPATS